MTYGLLGKTLAHSMSPRVHALMGYGEYSLFEVPEDELSDFMTKRDFDGINVTVPYKKAVLPFIDELSDKAKRAGCVNTVIKRADGSLFGDNTDVDGFRYLVKQSGIFLKNKKILILGSGGGAGAARVVAEDFGAREIVTVSRSGENNYGNIEKHSDADIIINATPVGMYPGNGDCPVDIDIFDNVMAVFDLIYNPLKTELVLRCEDRNIPAFGGLPMLVSQAARAEKLFFGKFISLHNMERITKTVLNETKNIIFIGMPGSGKTVMARKLAEYCGRECIDVDRVIMNETGRTTSDIISEDGEAEFRRIEAEFTKKICSKTGCVISCGGGVVTNRENRHSLRQNGTVIYLIRSLSALTTRNRPISMSRSLEELAAERIPLYKSWSDIRLLNTGFSNTLHNITTLLKIKGKERNDHKNENSDHKRS